MSYNKLVSQKSTGGNAPGPYQRRVAQKSTGGHAPRPFHRDRADFANNGEGPAEETETDLHGLIRAMARSDDGGQGHDWEGLLSCLSNADADELKVYESTSHRLPIHSMLSFVTDRQYWKRRRNAVKLMLELYPESEFERDLSGYTPLHIACLVDSNCADHELVRMFVNRNPRHVLEEMRHVEKERRERAQCGRLEEGSAADRLSERGSNTLHVACERPNFAVLSVLLSMDDERIKRRALGHVDGAGNLPIHVAVEKAAGIDTIKLLVIGKTHGSECCSIKYLNNFYNVF